MPAYKLTYFNIKGRAEPTRYMFALAGVEYTDNRIGGDDWKAFKQTLPLGQLPVLEVDGKQFAQSHAINRFVASELGFYGDTALERAEIDMVVETLLEVSPHVARIFGEQDADVKGELKKKFKEVTLPSTLERVEKLLKLNNGGKGWSVGNKVSMADVAAFNMLYDFLPVVVGEPIDLSKYQLVKGLVDRFEALPKVSAWIKSRPASSM